MTAFISGAMTVVSCDVAELNGHICSACIFVLSRLCFASGCRRRCCWTSSVSLSRPSWPGPGCCCFPCPSRRAACIDGSSWRSWNWHYRPTLLWSGFANSKWLCSSDTVLIAEREPADSVALLFQQSFGTTSPGSAFYVCSQNVILALWSSPFAGAAS